MNLLLRKRLGFLLLGGLALFLGASALLQLAGLPARYTFALVQADDVTIWQERINKLTGSLPPSGVIGYLSERDFPGLGGDAADQDEEFAMTQFAISPRILEQGASRDYIIANLAHTKGELVRALATGLGLRVQAEFGNGLYLFRRGQP